MDHLGVGKPVFAGPGDAVPRSHLCFADVAVRWPPHYGSIAIPAAVEFVCTKPEEGQEGFSLICGQAQSQLGFVLETAQERRESSGFAPDVFPETEPVRRADGGHELTRLGDSVARGGRKSLGRMDSWGGRF